MNTDIRLSTGFWFHPKTKRLIRDAGLEAVRSLQILWCWVAQNRPDGDISDLDCDDIEDAADWNGQRGEFYSSIRERWIDENEGKLLIHDWQEHNSWAAESGERSDESRLLKLSQVNRSAYDHLINEGRTGISKSEYVTYKKWQRNSDALAERNSDALAERLRCRSGPAPAPAPAPVQKETNQPSSTTQSEPEKQSAFSSPAVMGGRLRKPAEGKQASTGEWVNALGNGLKDWFEDEWWPAQLRMVGKKDCAIAIYNLNPDKLLRDRILAAYLEQRENDFSKRDPPKVPHPATWITGCRWEDKTQHSDPYGIEE